VSTEYRHMDRHLAKECHTVKTKDHELALRTEALALTTSLSTVMQVAAVLMLTEYV